LGIGLGVFIQLFEPLLAVGQWTVGRICLSGLGRYFGELCTLIACVKKAAARRGQQLFVILVAR